MTETDQTKIVENRSRSTEFKFNIFNASMDRKRIARYPEGYGPYRIDVSEMTENGVEGRGFFALLLLPGYLALFLYPASEEGVQRIRDGKYESNNRVYFTLPVLPASVEIRRLLRSFRPFRLAENGNPLDEYKHNALELTTPFLVDDQTEVTSQEPALKTSSRATAKRISKHAIAIQSTGLRPGFADLRVYGVGGSQAKLLLHALLEGPIPHKKFLWRFSPALVHLVRNCPKESAGKGLVCRGWKVEVGYKLKCDSKYKPHKQPLQEVTC